MLIELATSYEPAARDAATAALALSTDRAGLTVLFLTSGQAAAESVAIECARVGARTLGVERH